MSNVQASHFQASLFLFLFLIARPFLCPKMHERFWNQSRVSRWETTKWTSSYTLMTLHTQPPRGRTRSFCVCSWPYLETLAPKQWPFAIFEAWMVDMYAVILLAKNWLYTHSCHFLLCSWLSMGLSIHVARGALRQRQCLLFDKMRNQDYKHPW